MQQAKKQTIKQIEKLVNENVQNVVGIRKMSGTNTWFIFVKNLEDVKPAWEQLEAIGFEISDYIKSRLSNGESYNKNIMANFTGVRQTHYGQHHLYRGRN